MNAAPFALLIGTQLLIPNVSFLGHLAGVIMGYPLAWHALDWMQPPLVVAMCCAVLLQHSKAWPWCPTEVVDVRVQVNSTACPNYVGVAFF